MCPVPKEAIKAEIFPDNTAVTLVAVIRGGNAGSQGVELAAFHPNAARNPTQGTGISVGVGGENPRIQPCMTVFARGVAYVLVRVLFIALGRRPDGPEMAIEIGNIGMEIEAADAFHAFEDRGVARLGGGKFPGKIPLEVRIAECSRVVLAGLAEAQASQHEQRRDAPQEAPP